MAHLNELERKEAKLSSAFLFFLLEGKNTVTSEIFKHKVRLLKEDLRLVLEIEDDLLVNRFFHELTGSWVGYLLGEKKQITLHLHEDWALLVAKQTLFTFFATSKVEKIAVLRARMNDFFDSTEGKNALSETEYPKEEAQAFLVQFLIRNTVMAE